MGILILMLSRTVDLTDNTVNRVQFSKGILQSPAQWMGAVCSRERKKVRDYNL